MMTPAELDQLADAVAERIAVRLGGKVGADGLLNIHDVAELMGCSVPTVERLTRSGDLPSVKVGRLRRFLRSDLMDHLSGKGC